MALGPIFSLQELPTAILQFNAVGVGVMAKSGEGHPPPGAAMVRSGWCRSCATVATLLRLKMEPEGARNRDRWMKLDPDQMVEIGDPMTWSLVE